MTHLSLPVLWLPCHNIRQLYTSAIGFIVSALQTTSDVKSTRFLRNAMAEKMQLVSRKLIPHQRRHLLMQFHLRRLAFTRVQVNLS